MLNLHTLFLSKLEMGTHDIIEQSSDNKGWLLSYRFQLLIGMICHDDDRSSWLTHDENV